jgi:hypothetical protein
MTFFMPRVMNNVYPGFSEVRARQQYPFLNNGGYQTGGGSYTPTMMDRYYTPPPGGFWGGGCCLPGWAQQAANSVPIFGFLQQLTGMLKGDQS